MKLCSEMMNHTGVSKWQSIIVLNISSSGHMTAIEVHYYVVHLFLPFLYASIPFLKWDTIQSITPLCRNYSINNM